MHPHRRRGQTCAEDGRTGRRHGQCTGRRRRRAYGVGADHRAASPSIGRSERAGDRQRRLCRRARPCRRACLWRGRHRHGHALPADQGKPGA